MQAWETADINQLVELLKAEATFAMPPSPSWYSGRDAIRDFLSVTLFRGAPILRWRLQPIRANHQPAFGLFEIEPATERYRAAAIQVLSLDGGAIGDITTFVTPALFPRFNLPNELGTP